MTMHRSSRYPGIVSKVVRPLNEDELEETFTHSGGPGGQHANKVATRVTLKHLPTGLQVSADGERSQQANRKKARQKLALALERRAVRQAQLRRHQAEKARRQQSPRPKALKRRLVESKRHRSMVKARRGRVSSDEG